MGDWAEAMLSIAYTVLGAVPGNSILIIAPSFSVSMTRTGYPIQGVDLEA